MVTMLFIITFSIGNKVNSLYGEFHFLPEDNNQIQGILLAFVCEAWILMLPATVVKLKPFKLNSGVDSLMHVYPKGH